MYLQKLSRIVLFSLRAFLVLCFVVALYQNYIFDGAVELFGIKFEQFYPHVEVRIFPLLCASFFVIHWVQKILQLPGKYYWSEILISLITVVDAYTHINGFYGYSFNLPLVGRIWFDKVMHFSEGVVLLLALYPLLIEFVRKKMTVINVTAWAYWLIIGFVSIFFVAWEIVELLVDTNSNLRLISSMYDTNEDLTFAYVGFGLGIVLVELGKFLHRLFLPKGDKNNPMFTLKA